MQVSSVWLQNWYAATIPTSGNEADSQKHKQSISKVQAASSTDWEETFLRELRQRSRQETAELAECGASAVHAELKNQCGELTANHDQNERQMDQWICQWYRDCVERH
jgi:uncharacterized protein (DUF305 family)